MQQDLCLFLQFLLVTGHLLQPLVKLDAAAKLVDEIAGLFGGRGQIGGLALAEGRSHLLVHVGGRAVGLLGIALQGLAFFQALTYMAAGVAKPQENLRRKMRQAVGLGRLAQPHLFVLGEHRGVQLLALLFQFGNLAFQGAEPRLLLQRGGDPCGLPAQGLIHI